MFKDVSFINPVKRLPLTNPLVLVSARTANVRGRPFALSAEPTAGSVVNEITPERSEETTSPHL